MEKVSVEHGHEGGEGWTTCTLVGAFQMEGTESENALGDGVPGVWKKERVTMCVELNKKSENEVGEVRGGGDVTK